MVFVDRYHELKEVRKMKGKMEADKERNLEPQFLIKNFCDEIRKSKKIKLNVIQNELSKSTGLSVGIIRKYNGETSKYKPEMLLLGCIEVGLAYNISQDIVEEFLENCIRSFKKNSNYDVNFDNFLKNTNELEYHRKENKANKDIVCPQVLKDRLDSFLQKSNKRFLYLAGTYNSGITISVIKYFEEKNNGESPRIFDFYEKEMDEIKKSRALKASLLRDECVIIHIGFTTFPFSQMQFIGKGKVILLAHTPCENLYLEDIEYVVFNDLVNRIKCTGELWRKYVPGLTNGNLISEKEIEDVFIPKMREKTGGIPLAVYR